MNSKDKILSALSEIDFHDVPLYRLHFETDRTTKFSVDFALYNETLKGYDNYTLVFDHITKLETQQFILNSDSDMEIFGFDYEWNEIFEGHFMLLLGSNHPSCEIDFHCNDVQLKQY